MKNISIEQPTIEEYLVCIGYSICIFERKTKRKVYNRYQVAKQILSTICQEDIKAFIDIQKFTLNWLFSNHIKGIT
ncbi:MAG: hypothetical protein K0S47_4664 [Herbinix sp.]|jgi:hypothetical protein|nr:hypothetical protein [Herbinix sp.]